MVNKTSKDIKERVWDRLKDREKIPRRWWYPVQKENPLSSEEKQRQRDETSRTIRRVMMSLIGFSLFSLISLGSPDYYLITGEGVKIPFANALVPFRTFLFLSPLIMIGIFVYLHIFIGYSLWLGKIGPVEQLPFLFDMSNPIAVALSYFIFYALVPLVMVSFYWKAQPLGRLYVYFILILLTICVLIWLQIRRCPSDKRRRMVPVLWLFLFFFFLATILSPIYYKSINSPNSRFYRRLMLKDVDLQNRNLENISLIKANLHRANLRGANFNYAYLQNTYLKGADLTEAKLEGAILTDANLEEAKLNKAVLTRANLQGVILQWAELQGAILQGAILKGADLLSANFQGADLSGVQDLTDKQLSQVETLYEAKLDPVLKEQIKEKYPHLLEEPEKPR